MRSWSKSIRTERICHFPKVALLLGLTLLAACTSHGSQCASNSDCADSAVANSPQRCIGWEVYCASQQCKGRCGDECVVLRADQNPCSEGICKRSLSAGDPYGYCTTVPISCDMADTCPQYRPPLPDGSQSDWTCEDRVCRYPGFTYPTH